ncbi:MAG: iron ABC transporter permease [Burkholderiaceae bacterium]
MLLLRQRLPAWAGMLTAGGVLLAATVLAFLVGRFPVSAGDLMQLLWARLSGQDSGLAPAVETVLLQVRGPRVLAALAVGAALSVAGAAFQGLFRNPLVSPDILGASAGAALGAVLAIFLSLGIFAIQGFAFAGGLLAVALVYALGAGLRSADPVLGLLLTGIVIGSLLGAGIGLLKYLADPYDQLPAMTFWLLGSLSGTAAPDLLPLLGPVAAGMLMLLPLRWKLNVMSLPDDEARALGAPTTLLRLLIVAAATLVTAASVAAAGIVGWVGLVVPHLARALVGPSFPRLLPASALLGGGFLLVIDTLARTLAPVEIPLGVLTAVVGTPFFIALLRSQQRGWA